MALRTRLHAAIGAPRRGRASALRRRLASERGFAVPTVLLMLVAAMGVASVAVMTSIQAQSGTVRDQGSKSALAVAESGVQQALLYYNRGASPCEPAAEGEWCGPVTGMSVNGGDVAYWTRLSNSEECEVVEVGGCVEIVSQGTVGGVTRRVDVFASSLQSQDSSPPQPFSTAGVLSYESITVASNSTIHTGTATNGNILLTGNARLCGPASVGVGKEVNTENNSDHYSDAECTTLTESELEEELTLPPVNQGDAVTENDNDRFFEQDVVTAEHGNSYDACWSGFDAGGEPTGDCGEERELKVDNNAVLTLGGSVYSFCKLTMLSNSSLRVQAGEDVTIYIDSPEACGYQSGVTQLDLDSNSRITSATGEPISVAILVVGSESLETNILLNSNTSVNGPCDQNFVVYAPRSDVTLNSNTKFCGAIAGKSVHLDQNAEIWSASSSDEFTLPGSEFPPTAPHYEPFRYVECSAAAASAPDDGC